MTRWAAALAGVPNGAALNGNRQRKTREMIKLPETGSNLIAAAETSWRASSLEGEVAVKADRPEQRWKAGRRRKLA
ncbi:hypothetical protein [Mesorhizobium sp. M0977]|uniref:hypothetical protein n=1 Tax=Mesorhizobium sp. M0977 TaxID=2957039 RepID=UPI00333A4CA2